MSAVKVCPSSSYSMRVVLMNPYAKTRPAKSLSSVTHTLPSSLMFAAIFDVMSSYQSFCISFTAFGGTRSGNTP